MHNHSYLHNQNKYNHISEVPLNECNQWAEKHCASCGTPLADILDAWNEANAQAAETASPDTIQYVIEQYNLDSYADAIEVIRQGALMDGYPIYTVTTKKRPHCSWDEKYHVCSHCFHEMLDLQLPPDASDARDLDSLITPN